MGPVDENNGELYERAIPAIARGIKGLIQTRVMPYRELMAYYQCALMEVETKFRVLNEEFSIEYDRNPIETIKTRLKSTDSIADKLVRRGLAPTIDNIESHIFDVAGIRVICGLPSDIYALSNAFTSQDDITVDVYKRQPLYYGFIGEKPTIESLAVELGELPPGCSSEQKRTVGYFDRSGKLAAFLDLVYDYPDERCAYICLLYTSRCV